MQDLNVSKIGKCRNLKLTKNGKKLKTKIYQKLDIMNINYLIRYISQVDTVTKILLYQ